MEIVHREEFLKLYIKTYLQKTFETLYSILTNNSNLGKWNLLVTCSACSVAIVIQSNHVVNECTS